MMDIPRIDSGKLTLKLQYISVNEFMAEIMRRMALHFTDFNHLVKININTPVIAYWDPLRIEHVMINLISNAFRYGDGKEIILNASIKNGKFLLSVRDNGPGLTKENQELIFERFKDTVNENENSGLGLELFIANGIIKAHAGQMHLESIAGNGSTFTVEIPLSACLTSLPA